MLFLGRRRGTPIASSRGFTLIELTLTIVVVAMLVILALPKFMDMGKRAQLAAAEHFEGSLKEARDMYYMRLYLDAPSVWRTIQKSFFSFVGFSSGTSSRNTVEVDQTLRTLLQNPNAEVYDGAKLTLVFKGGGTAVYSIDPVTGIVTASYTGF